MHHHNINQNDESHNTIYYKIQIRNFAIYSLFNNNDSNYYFFLTTGATENPLKSRKLNCTKMKKKSLILTFSLFSMYSFSQNFDYKNLAKNEGANFYEIVTQTREHFKSVDLSILENKKANKQFERWAYYWENKINPDGTFPSENLEFYNAGILDKNGKVIATQNEANRSALSSQSWTNIGPSQTDLNNNSYPNYPQMGRLNAFLRIKHPTDVNQDVLFVGAPNGGIWKSTNNGTTWTPKTDFIAAIGVTDIKTLPGTTTDNYLTRPIFVSTGDYDGNQTKSIGVLKSTDGGETFISTAFSFTLD